MTNKVRTFMLAFWLCSQTFAAPTGTNAHAEISQLLARLQSSGCQFSRNGTWYSSIEAKDHLTHKLEYIEDKRPVASTEEFITLAATKSSVSGKAYQVQCKGQTAVNSQTWLMQQLTEMRSASLSASH